MNVLQYLASTIERHGTRAAMQDSSRSVSFEELAAEASGLARRLLAVAPERNQPVLVFIDKSVDALIAFVAVLLAGKCYCPVDIKSPDGRLAAVISNLDPVAVITTERHRQRVNGFELDCPVLEVDATGAEPELFRRLLTACLDANIDADPAYIIYTSGSTGVPKGVTIAHRSIIDYIDWALATFDVTCSDRIASQAPFYFDNSTLDIYLCLAAGASLLLTPEVCFTFPARLIDYLRDERITFVFWVPSVLVNVANLGLLAEETLPDLRAVLFAGEAMPAKQLGYWMDRLGDRLFANLYGPTEITVDCTYCKLTRSDIDDGQVPIGRACRNTDVIILDDVDCLAGPMEPGELCVRGTSLALGYWRDPERTRKVFVQNPLHADYLDPIYRTGDLVMRRQDGNILFVGRKDNQIKHLGYRIELGEIEAVAERFATVGRSAAVYDAERQELSLFVEPVGEYAEASLRGHLTMSLPRYMMPKRVHCLDALPLNANGKIDRLALRSLLGPQE